MPETYPQMDFRKDSIRILVSPEVALDYQDVEVVVNGEVVEPSQDWEESPRTLLRNADTLSLEADGESYPIPTSGLDSGVFDMLLEKISPT